MIIKKSRINSVDKYFANIAEDKEVYVSVPADESNIDLLKMDGCLDGTCVVPQPIGPVTMFNLYGKELVHKEMEKESREIERDYHIVDWHGTPLTQGVPEKHMHPRLPCVSWVSSEYCFSYTEVSLQDRQRNPMKRFLINQFLWDLLVQGTVTMTGIIFLQPYRP